MKPPIHHRRFHLHYKSEKQNPRIDNKSVMRSFVSVILRV